MVLFTGFSLAQPFSMEAEGPLELIEKLGLPGDEPFSDYRMWIKILTPSGREAWQDVCVSSLSEGIYKEALKLCENKTKINVVIRGQKENSPQSSPRGETGDEPSTPAKPPPSTPNDHGLQKTLSSLTESTSELTIGPATQPIRSKNSFRWPRTNANRSFSWTFRP